MAHEIFRMLPFPFPDHRFPPELGAVVQRTVHEGKLPALSVIHSADNSWIVLDGVNDPNVEGAVLVDAMVHLVEADPTLADMARLDAGNRADRDEVGGKWQVFRDAPLP
ncbi:hypothetical protein [Actinoplanes sp. NPDC089786]|uniref:hypothetical protein n=1 Tax=Actinoplanes sp. NPDC089786 TaxID=3155185 RepID=UPI0034310ABE